MGTRIPTVPYSSPSLEGLLERGGAGGRSPAPSAATSSSHRSPVKRPTAPLQAPLATDPPLVYAAYALAAGGIAVLVGATIGGSKALRIGALAAAGVAALALLVARAARPPRS